MTAPDILKNLPAIDESRLAWEPLREGIDASWLYRNGEDGPAAALLRYRPGARVPLHRHRGYEHIYILRGSQTDGRGTLPAGSFIVNSPGSEHAVRSDDGCLALLIWQVPIEIIGV
jgi:anti-sigma factor ChrR (cupin superfamily)